MGIERHFFTFFFYFYFLFFWWVVVSCERDGDRETCGGARPNCPPVLNLAKAIHATRSAAMAPLMAGSSNISTHFIRTS